MHQIFFSVNLVFFSRSAGARRMFGDRVHDMNNRMVLNTLYPNEIFVHSWDEYSRSGKIAQRYAGFVSLPKTETAVRASVKYKYFNNSKGRTLLRKHSHCGPDKINSTTACGRVSLSWRHSTHDLFQKCRMLNCCTGTVQTTLQAASKETGGDIFVPYVGGMGTTDGCDRKFSWSTLTSLVLVVLFQNSIVHVYPYHLYTYRSPW